MNPSAVLIVGSPAACTVAVATLRAAPHFASVDIASAHGIDDAALILAKDDRIAVTLLLWESEDPAGLPLRVKAVQAHQRNPLMAVCVRSEIALPPAIAERLWELGVADRHFALHWEGRELADTLLVALREYARHRMLCAIAEASTRLDKAGSFGELAGLALHILHEQGIARRGAMFCFQRNTSGPQLLAVAGTGLYAAVDCTAVEQIADERTRSIVQRAWNDRSSRFADDLAALYVGTQTQAHPALILLALDAPPLPWQTCMLESFAKAIAPAVEESQLAQQLVRTQRAMISTLATLAEYKDTDTGEHVARVGRITAEIASFLRQSTDDAGIDVYFIENIGHASILHDLGKVAIPETVLLKPGALDAAERAVINSHVFIGHEILRKAEALAEHGEARLFRLASEIALSHHERYDGSGYPHGLKGEAIPLSARIVAVVDVFDALISPRPYKSPWSVEKAIDLIRTEAGRHFDPKVVAAFMAVHERKAAAQFIQWSENMSVGHAELDRDHQRLIGILNHLGINMELGNRNIVEFILDDLSNYAQVHFLREERHLENIGFPELGRHHDIHRSISQRIEDAKWKYFQGLSATLESELLHFLTRWLNHHILVEDMKYNPGVADGAKT